jgi:2-keto-3-deoxy-L-rhamnonate aldolase RhmA
MRGSHEGERMRAQRLLGALAEGRVVFGTGVHSPDPAIVEIIDLAGYDWISVVLEHSTLTVEQVAVLQRAADVRGITTIVHVKDADDPRIGALLDEGIGGFVLTLVTTPEEVEAIVNGVRFPPRGARGASGGVRSADFGRTPFTEYTQRTDRETAVGIVIETTEAVEDIDRILAVDGLNFAYIGLTDLSQSMGLPGEFKHPDVRAAIERVVASGNKAGVTIGFAEYGYTAAEVYEIGGRMILAPSSDYPFFQRVLSRHLADAKASIGGAAE